MVSGCLGFTRMLEESMSEPFELYVYIAGIILFLSGQADIFSLLGYINTTIRCTILDTSVFNQPTNQSPQLLSTTSPSVN